MIMR